jgi:PAS domain S-box-containing protein
MRFPNVRKKARAYTSSTMTRYETIDDLPAKLRPIAEEILSAQPTLKVTVDEHRRNVSVSEEFAHLLGYTSGDLVGKPIDDITANGTVDIDFIFRISRRFGEMQGLWLFESRDGQKLLCSYRARRSDSELTAEFTPLLVAA